MKEPQRNTIKSKFKTIDKRWKEYALAGCVCILFFFCLMHISEILSFVGGFFRLFRTVIIGAIIAYIVNPLAVCAENKLLKKLKKEKLRWILSVVIALVVVLAVLSLLTAALIPQIIENILSIVRNLDQYFANLQSTVHRMNLPFGDLIISYFDEISGDNGILLKLVNLFSDNLETIVRTTSNIGSAAVNWGIGAIFAIYFLLSKHAILRMFDIFLNLVLRPRTYHNTLRLLGKFHAIFSKFIIFEILDSLIIGLANCVIMLIAGMPDALFVSAVVGITNLVPTFGPLVGAAIGGFILLLVKPSCVLFFLIVALVLQLIDGYLLKPKLFGGALNVPGVLILIAIIIFGRLMGVVGMLIAIPFAAIIVYFYTELLIPRLELRRDLQEYRHETQQASAETTESPNQEP